MEFILSTANAFTLYQRTKFLDWSRLKVFADDKINVTEKLKLVLERTENILDYQHFLLFPKCFQNPLPWELLKVEIVW